MIDAGPSAGFFSRFQSARGKVFAVFDESSGLFEKSVKKQATSRLDLSGLHCLIVDDSKLNRKMMHRLLDTFDITVAEALDGQECVDTVRSLLAASNSNIDVILMDNMYIYFNT
jgi:PleD family two-component response regulator